MNVRALVRLARFALLPLLLAGCGGGGPDEDRLENRNPGTNDLNVVVAFGDSITRGSECACEPYPRRLAALVGKSVLNTGVSASRAIENVSRTQEAIDKYHPAFMLILYGVNDVIHGAGSAGIVNAVDQMVQICKQNNVVPVVATYPVPIAEHWIFSGGTISLNAGIRAIADAEGIHCVDLEAEFMGDQWTDPTLMLPDCLHPNDAGTQIMALAFADLF